VGVEEKRVALVRETLGKDKVFSLAQYTPLTQEVVDFHNSQARTRIAHAPARTSKSYAAAHEAFYHCFPSFEKMPDGRFSFHREPTGDRRIWIVGPDYKTIKEWDYLWWHIVIQKRRTPLGRLYRLLTKCNSPQQGNMKIVMEFAPDPDGNQVRTVIEGKSATNAESLQGEQVYLAVLSEAAEMDEKILGRYLGTRCKYVLAPTTPKLSAAWLKKLIDDGSEHPELSIESFQFTPYANPEYDWDLYWIEHAKAESRTAGKIMTPPRGHDCFASLAACAAAADPWFSEQFQGQWTGAEERLLPFGAHHVIDTVPDWASSARSFVACDYGYADAAVALFFAIGERDHLVILSEVYERQITATEFVGKIREKASALGARPDYYVGDPKQPQIARLLRDRGLPVWDVDKRAMADRAAGYHAIIDAMSLDPVTGTAKLRVLSEKAGAPYGCPQTIREMKNLRRKIGGSALEFSTGAVIGADHSCDATRYALQTRPKPKSIEPDTEMRRYLASLRRRAAHAAPPSLGRLVGGAPRQIAGVL